MMLIDIGILLNKWQASYLYTVNNVIITPQLLNTFDSHYYPSSLLCYCNVLPICLNQIKKKMAYFILYFVCSLQCAPAATGLPVKANKWLSYDNRLVMQQLAIVLFIPSDINFLLQKHISTSKHLVSIDERLCLITKWPISMCPDKGLSTTTLLWLAFWIFWLVFTVDACTWNVCQINNPFHSNGFCP